MIDDDVDDDDDDDVKKKRYFFAGEFLRSYPTHQQQVKTFACTSECFCRQKNNPWPDKFSNKQAP